METNIMDNDQVVFFIIVNKGTGSRVLKKLNDKGIKGGTCFLATGTAKNHVLKLLGLDEIKKEVVLIITDKSREDRVHDMLNNKLELYKPNHGIAFSISIKKIFDYKKPKNNEKLKAGGVDKMGYEVIFTIVDRGLADDVVDASVLAGAKGGTIIHGRYADSDDSNTFFSMHFEPEKEIIMTIVEESKTNNIMEFIKKSMETKEKDKCTMFVLDINRASGILNNNLV